MAKAPAPHEDRDVEADLIERAQRGCRDSYSRLVQLHQDRLTNFLLRRLRNEHEAEEIAQAAFVRAWLNLSKFDAAWRFSTWLYTIAVRLAANDAQRTRRDRTARLSIDTSAKGEIDPSAGPSAREERETLWAVADQVLTPDERAAIWLRYADDAPIGQIARVLGKSNVAARVMLHRARKRLLEAWNAGAKNMNREPARPCGSGGRSAPLHAGHNAVPCTGGDR